MSDLIIPILITLLIIGLVGIVLRLDKVFFKRKDERDDFEWARPVVRCVFGNAEDVQEAWLVSLWTDAVFGKFFTQQKDE